MGAYDTFGKLGIQSKISEDFRFYKVGDKVSEDYQDGVYVGYEGVFVVIKGKFVAEFPRMINKWGGEIESAEVISNDNPIKQTLDSTELRAKDQIKKCFDAVKALPFPELNLHGATLPELVFHIHAIQNILIAEYARHTGIKEELELR